jgi:hypothetical protein
MKLTRGNGEDLVFATALSQAGGAQRQLLPADPAASAYAEGGWRANSSSYHLRPEHWAQRARICFCLASGSVGGELAGCVNAGWGRGEAAGQVYTVQAPAHELHVPVGPHDG